MLCACASIAMKLLILSDLHLEHRPFELPAAGCDVVVLAGDIGCPGHRAVAWARQVLPPGTQAVFVPGNHEYYGSSREAERHRMREAAGSGPVHLLDGDRVVIDGVRFLGCTLWTDFRLRIETAFSDEPQSDADTGRSACAQVLADYRCIRRDDAPGQMLRPDDTAAWHEDQRAWLLHQLRQPFDGPTVVITHHAPHRLSLAERFASDWASTGFVNELPPEFFQVPVLWIHGHTHTSFDYRVGNCRVVCNPRGYPVGNARTENERFDPAFIGELSQ